MHIVIANGDSDAAYIIDMFNTKENRLTVINGSEAVAQTLMERKHIAVTIGDPWHNAILEAARVYDADIFISLCKKDTDNFAACLMAKRNFHIKKCICAVSNPSNVELYKKLGLDHDDLLVVERERFDEGFRIGLVLDRFGKEVGRRDDDVDAKFLIKVNV